MYRSLLLLLFCFMATAAVSGQACCSAFRDLGKKAFKDGYYDKAIGYYNKAKTCGDAARCTDIASLIDEANKAIADNDSRAIFGLAEIGERERNQYNILLLISWHRMFIIYAQNGFI